ncbi:CapA family protein [Actinomadura sp. HBU206391]|uniref:CapA family protein n=1 Tax=Actinomadura sp. HBU206391 TaxID=2731692 RepID=UPI0016500C15|nr:CapA family protein [Actinomadura sp. HBU206391]MBC6463026.1 CapA family protein [Actinomadura sp. HBU206391]
MPIKVALAGDTMLGRKVAERLATVAPRELFSDGLRQILATADLIVINLECCVSDRGRPWDAPGKMFHFRAPPRAVEALASLGVHCVTLANNHALDFGYDALADTRTHLTGAGIRVVGAGADQAQARSAAVLRARGARLAVLGVTDHPEDFAATADRPGVAYADLRRGVPGWLPEEVRRLRRDVGTVIVTPHWGPNMTTEPPPYVREAAAALLEAGAALVVGHSAHVFHGVDWPVVFDAGDFIDDYAVDPLKRNDLGLLFMVTLDERGPRLIEGVPLALDYCRTRLAEGAEREWIRRRFTESCAAFGSEVRAEHGRLVLAGRDPLDS